MPDVAKTAERDITLGFGGEQYFLLVVAGVFGMVPGCTWLMMLTVPFDLEHTRLPQVVDIIGVAVTLFMMLVAPWLAAVLILRARQPLGARLTWTSDVLIEWDGPDQRTVIPWRAAQAFEHTWTIQTKYGPRPQSALQVFDPNTKAAITVWTTLPDEVRSIRRRISCAEVSRVRTAIVTHGVGINGEPDWSRAFEPGRPPPSRWFLLSRFGYAIAVFAPLLMPTDARLGLGLSALAFCLLTVRAVPVFRELVALQSSEAPWDRRKLRAVRAEALVRSAFVALVIYSAWAAMMFLH